MLEAAVLEPTREQVARAPEANVNALSILRNVLSYHHGTFEAQHVRDEQIAAFLESTIFPTITQVYRRHMPEATDDALHDALEARFSILLSLACGVPIEDVANVRNVSTNTIQSGVKDILRAIHNVDSPYGSTDLRQKFAEHSPDAIVHGRNAPDRTSRVLGRLIVKRTTDTQAADGGSESRSLLSLYLEDIGKTPLLTAEQEVDLAIRIEAGLMAEHTVRIHDTDFNDQDLRVLRREARAGAQARRTLDSGEKLTTTQKAALNATITASQVAKRTLAAQGKNLSDQERVELEWFVEDGRMAKTHFINANLRLVVSEAKKRYAKSSLELLDRIQEGNSGLLRAVQKFDYTRGYKFSTYATFWIVQAIQQGVYDTALTIRRPKDIEEKLHKIYRFRQNHLKLTGIEPTVQEIAAEFDLNPEKVVEIQGYDRDVISLDAPISEDGNSTLNDLELMPSRETVPEQVLASLERVHIMKHIRGLTDLEADVILHSFEFPGGAEDLRTIATKYDVEPSRISMLRARAIHKLQRSISQDSALAIQAS